MKRAIILTLAVAAVLSAGTAAVADTDPQRRAIELARELHLIDTHIDVPYRLREGWEDVTRATEDGDFDYPRARAGGLDTAFMSIYTPASEETGGDAFLLANQLIDSVEALAGRAPEKFVLAHSVSDAERARKAGRIGLALGLENGAPVAGELDNLRHFWDRGVRYITLAHSRSNHIADSSYDEIRIWKGLSPFGRRVVKEMNRLGIMIDVSHLSDQATGQVLSQSEAPVIASHSSARQFTPDFERNLSDELIRGLAANGGVIMINFGSSFLTAEANAWAEAYWDLRAAWLEEHELNADGPQAEAFKNNYREAHPFPYAKTADVADHIEHVVKLVGVEHVGLGSDFDGVGDSLPRGLEDVSAYPNLIAELLRRGWSEADLRLLLGENLLRVWRAVEAAAVG